jgi:hypothetical protein
MKPFRNFIFLSAIFLSVIFSCVNSCHADSLSAALGGDGVVTLSGSCSVECIPSGFPHPVFAIATLYMTPGGPSGYPLCTIYSGTTEVDINNCQFNLACNYPGDYTFSAQCAGGRWQTNAQGQHICVMGSFPAVYDTVNLPKGREISIDAPVERVAGTENISVSYNVFSFNKFL